MKQLISTARRRFSRIASYRVLAGGLALTLSVLVGTAPASNSPSFNDTQLAPPPPAAQPPASGTMTAPALASASPTAGGSLAVGQAYYYKVTALGVTGESIGSNE